MADSDFASEMANPASYLPIETRELQADAVALYEQGKSERAVAAELGITRTRVRELLDQANVLKRPVGRPRAEH